LPFAEYITCASPLIEVNLRNLLSYNKNNLCTVNNFFLKNEFKSPSDILSKKIKLIWFSQNINAGRGLELILSIWNEIKQYFELTLIGKIDPVFYDNCIKNHSDIIIKSPLSQTDLHSNLFLYDIGLAIDVDNKDYNRKLAITNKILAYFQAGLYILATDTPAQQNFMDDHSLHGTIVQQSSCAIQNSLMEIYSKKEQIRKLNKQRYKDASLYSWDRESEKILSIWRKLLE
jgi:glycosyltransferase involved in cell wall biosynthesis